MPAKLPPITIAVVNLALPLRTGREGSRWEVSISSDGDKMPATKATTTSVMKPN
jgi:hypothetical protein